MAQVQAAIQMIKAEKLADSPEYASRVASDGQKKADRWLNETSLRGRRFCCSLEYRPAAPPGPRSAIVIKIPELSGTFQSSG